MKPEVPISTKILELNTGFSDARIPHAFGGALALAWCTKRARGTIDIDVNVFVDPLDSDNVFASQIVPFLSCSDVAVFKAFFNRPRDWADLSEMCEAGTLDTNLVVGALVRYLGPHDERIAKLHVPADEQRK